MSLENEDDDERLFSRSYQSHLEEIAIRKNTIIHLPTGSGKTYIATRVIKRFRKALQEPWGSGGKRTFFVVNTVPLVVQQRNYIRKWCPVDGVEGYSSEDKVDYWDKRKWDQELIKNQVLVMTCQILYDMLTHAYIRVEDINLIIFDECHHAVEDHPMRQTMKMFELCPVEKQPRVLGLTATLLNANVNLPQVQEMMNELERTFHATIATVNEFGEILNYSTNPREIIMYYHSLPPTDAVTEAINLLDALQAMIITINLPPFRKIHGVKLQHGQRDITTDPKKIVKLVRNMVVSMITLLKEFGAYGGALGILAYIILLERLKRKCVIEEEELLYQITITHSLEARMVLLDSMENDTGLNKIKKHSSPKFLQLLSILKEYDPNYNNVPPGHLKVNINKQPLSGIIFVQQRFTAKVLYNLLKEVVKAAPEDYAFLKHDFIVGFNINPFNNTREAHYIKKNGQKALLKFKNKELNCLISTSVIEEGVDISQCLLVLRFDPPIDYRSYIQCKGRARSAESNFVVMVHEPNKSKYLSSYNKFQDIENYIQKLLCKDNERDTPTLEDIKSGLYEDDDIPPYVTPNGNRLLAASAISLLSRYCSVLPHDQFTVITPMWIVEKAVGNNSEELRKITILMPIACPVKEQVQGSFFRNLKTAKRSAALNACIRLHQEGELDEFTLLPRKQGVIDFDHVDVMSCFPNWQTEDIVDKCADAPLPGTKKMVRKHEKIFPQCLSAPKVWTTHERKFYLHIIKMDPTFDEPVESREKALYKLLQKGEGYGILTPSPLPDLCEFPMFLTVGEVTTSLLLNYAVIALTSQTFNLVKQFHYFLFDKVLEVAKKFLAYDGEHNNMFVVPVTENEGYDIDWEVMTTYNNIRPVDILPDQERMSINVTKDNYQYCVVTPWYRSTILPDRYIVSNVIEYMSPQSQFDNNSYCSYADYYRSKYNIEIMRKDQPLLEVRNISTRMNCLLPRAATIKTLTEKQQKLISIALGDDKLKGFCEFFIPELCIKYDFPGVLWYKATILPCIVHRVFMLLVAEELRQEIAAATKYGIIRLSNGEKWQPIEVNLNIVKKSLLSHIEEPNPINSIDRINNPIDETAPRPVNIVSMKEAIYKLQTKKISKEYPWNEEMEPVDIERNISSVTVMDLECYDEFVSTLIKENTEPSVKSPVKPTTSGAIMAPPSKYIDKLSILSRTLSNRGPELKDVLAALTTIKSHDSFDLERVELLGDSFLKFAASLYLFHKFPKLNEGQLTNIKCRLIGNKNLFYAGQRARLGGRMKVEQFSPRKDFLVPGFFAPEEAVQFINNKQLRPTFLIPMHFSLSERLNGKLSEDSIEMMQRRYLDIYGDSENETPGQAQPNMQSYIKMQAVDDKSVADCVEALIGTYLISGGILGAILFLEWMRIIPKQDNLAKLLHKSVPTVITEKIATVSEVDYILSHSRPDIENILQYKFNDPSLLLEAVSHPSYIRNRLTRSYERLEFLGDAIIDFLITAHIYENSGELKPGEMTDLRSALVNNVTFASYIVKLGLYKHLCSQSNPNLDQVIGAFVDHQEQRNHEIVEDVIYLIEEDECRIAEYVEVPKVLSDLFESLTGAIYLDSGGNLETVWKVIYRIMWKEIDLFSKRIPKQPVRTLYENVHACPLFGDPRVTNSDVPKVMIPVTVTKEGRQITVHGFGNNKFQAKRAAAKMALKVLAL